MALQHADGSRSIVIMSAAHCTEPQLLTRFGGAVHHQGFAAMNDTGISEKPGFSRWSDDMDLQDLEVQMLSC